jgi:hypothetical protein
MEWGEVEREREREIKRETGIKMKKEYIYKIEETKKKSTSQSINE